MQHFGRAADELHLTHGAISRAVRLLENELGVALFERRSRRVHLTEAGRTLAQAVHDGLALMRNATRELRRQQSKRWVLSCEPTLLMRWLIPRWPDFRKKHPDADFHLVAGGGAFSFADGIDLAIRRDDFVLPAKHHSEDLFCELTGLVCRPDKAAEFFENKGKTPHLRAGAPRLHTRTRPKAWQEWAVASRLALPKGGKSQTFDHFYFSLQAAVAGLGVAVASRHMVREDMANGLLAAPLGFVDDGSRYCLLAPEAIKPGSAPAALMAWLRATA